MTCQPYSWCLICSSVVCFCFFQINCVENLQMSPPLLTVHLVYCRVLLTDEQKKKKWPLIFPCFICFAVIFYMALSVLIFHVFLLFSLWTSTYVLYSVFSCWTHGIPWALPRFCFQGPTLFWGFKSTCSLNICTLALWLQVSGFTVFFSISRAPCLSCFWTVGHWLLSLQAFTFSPRLTYKTLISL